MANKQRKNLILYAVATVLCLLAAVMCGFLFSRQTVALEQTVRCSIKEHTHTDQCYHEDLLTCKTLAHAHDENCYLVLLRDNDINALLGYINRTEDYSLESVLHDTIGSALRLNPTLNSAETEPTLETLQYNKETVSALNSTIGNDRTAAALTLNEEINTYASAITDSSLPQSNGGGATTLAVGDSPSSSGNRLNLYVYLDNQWQCIGNIAYTSSGRSGTVNTATMMSFINEQLGTELTSNQVKLYYTTSATTSNYRTSVTVRNTTSFTLSSVNSRAVYGRLVGVSDTNASNPSLKFYSVTFTYPDGTSEVRYVRAGSTITLPSGNYLWQSGGNDYEPGTAITVNAKTTFTAQLLGPITAVHIEYDLNFPTVGNHTVATRPTIATTGSETLDESYSEGLSATLHNASQTDVWASLNGSTTNVHRVIHFKGWQIEGTDVILEPNTTLLWEEMLAYSTYGRLSLIGVWQYDSVQTADFYVRYDSVAVDTDGNITSQDSNLYTKSLWASFVDGANDGKSYNQLTQYNIADTTSDNSYGADQEIRALYGATDNGGVWLTSFPTDDYIFEQLKTYASQGKLSVKTDSGDTVIVAPEDLNSNAYAIRWYVFKTQSDAWHIDGKLVRKEGIIHVTKTFAGNKELIQEAKKDFYITATNAALTNVHDLTLNNYTSHDAITDTYVWDITDVKYGELWTITEHPHIFPDPSIDFSVYSEFTVIDASGAQTTTGAGTSVTVQGMTYALDEGDPEVLRAGFTNIYNRSDSIIIKKQDIKTGNALDGAVFRLLQNGVALKFNYNEATHAYEWDQQNGTHTHLSASENGYFELLIEEFSYENGAVTIQEVQAPEGYTPTEDVVVGYTDDTHTTVGILSGGNGMAQYHGGLLVVGNSTDSITVTAQKEWDCPESEWAEVTVQLMANDRLVTHLLAEVTPTVTLNAANNWQYVWPNLPTYVNGTAITYSLREIRIGTEQCKADYTFMNWIASYDSKRTVTEQGENFLLLTVTNNTKRVLLRLTKMDALTHDRLSNVTFLLEALKADGTVDTSMVAKTLTTNENGVLIFDNLKVNVRYRLTELPLDGYYPIEPIYFTIGEDGTVAVETHSFASASANAYNIVVYNQAAIPLPISGGSGSHHYIAWGILLMLIPCFYIARKLLGRRFS
ncbi:MAG: Cna B-type domain-containing protein [Clostridia bacterium]|nr:Cna B-type domain-containing protein [Clostridia bacterium]